MPLDEKDNGSTWMNVGLAAFEMEELVLLIDDKSVDEAVLKGIRRKLVHKQKMLRRKQAQSNRPRDGADIS